MRCCLTDVLPFCVEGSDGNSAAVPGLSAQALAYPGAAVGADQCPAGEQMRLCFNLTTRCWSAPRPEPLKRNGKYMYVVTSVCVHRSAHYFVPGHSFSLSLAFKSQEPWNFKIFTFTEKPHHIFRLKEAVKPLNYLKSNLQMKILTWTFGAQTRFRSQQISLIYFDFIGQMFFLASVVEFVFYLCNKAAEI